MSEKTTENTVLYKYTTYASVAFIFVISIAFGITIYQLQVGIKETVDSQLKSVRAELDETISKATSNDLSDVIRIVNAELENKIDTIADFFPTGALMAFDRVNCPSGWEEFSQASGRVIVAAGIGKRLSKRLLGEIGGEESHVLTIEEVPDHQHSYTDTSIKHGAGGWLSGGGSSNNYPNNRKTSATGGGKWHNNMPPYYVATLCRKT